MTFKKPEHAEKPANAAGPTRPRILQNPLDRALYHPLSARLAGLLARTPITPNMVSVAGGITVVLAGIAYIQPGWPFAALIGLCLHMSWHVLDGADGDLARLTGRTSPTGEIVDGICDYAGHIVLYLTLAGAAFATAGWAVWVLVFAAGASRIVQANFYEAQRRQFLSWVEGVPWLRTSREDVRSAPIGTLGSAYLAVADRLAPREEQIDQAIADPSRSARVRAVLIDLGPNALSGGGLLGANYRTLALGLSMLAGSPLWYFLYEIVILNLVLAHGIWRSRGNLAAIRATL